MFVPAARWPKFGHEIGDDVGPPYGVAQLIFVLAMPDGPHTREGFWGRCPQRGKAPVSKVGKEVNETPLRNSCASTHGSSGYFSPGCVPYGLAPLHRTRVFNRIEGEVTAGR